MEGEGKREVENKERWRHAYERREKKERSIGRQQGAGKKVERVETEVRGKE